MGDKSRIEWTEATWNPVTGCSPVSEGCENCYAKREAEGRLRGRCGYDRDDPFKVAFHPERLDQPSRWSKPRRIFVCSMGDLFHEDVEDEWLNRVFLEMAVSTRHTYIVLTKRPERMRAFVLGKIPFVKDAGVAGPGLFPHVWLGVTAENQARADERIPVLLDTPAAVRFVSVEPMLGPVDLARWMRPKQRFFNALCEVCGNVVGEKPPYVDSGEVGLDWVICGGETGYNARLMHPDWARSLRDQCLSAGVPFFFKSWGEHCSPSQMPGDTFRDWDIQHGTENCWNSDDPRWKVGKKAAGRSVDGRTWDEYPVIERG